MAAKGEVYQAVNSVDELRELLDCPSSVHVGHNVQCGFSEVQIHKATLNTMKTNSEKILNRHFRELGVAAAHGKDGKLFVCQYFRSKMPNNKTI